MSNVSVRFKNTGVVNVGADVYVVGSVGSNITLHPQQTVDLNVGNSSTQTVKSAGSNTANVAVNVHNLDSTLSIYCAASNGSTNVTIGPGLTRTKNVTANLFQTVGLI